MKVIGIVLVLCLAGAMGQTTEAPSQFNCYLDSIFDPDFPAACAQEFSNSLPSNGDSVNVEALQRFCSDGCGAQFNTFLMDKCQSPVILGICSMDDDGFCVGRNETVLYQNIATAIAEPCLNTDCSNATCNSAVQDISCCLDGLAIVTEFIGFNLNTIVLPSGCMAPACDTTVGGAALIIAMPLAIVMSLLLALVAVL